MKNQHTQRGFSLIELMISITIGLILMTGVVQMFLSSKQVFSTQQGISRIQETGRLAIDFMAKDIREAGYMGCLSRTSPQITNTLNDPDAFKWDFSVAIEAFTDEPDGSDLDPNPRADTDILTVRSAAGSGASVAGSTKSGQVFVTLTAGSGSDCPSDICDDDILIVTDCAKARIFQATNVQETSGEVNISHAASGDPGNAISSWGGAKQGPEGKFDIGSEVIKVSTIVYYIADDANGNPGLYQKIGNDPAFQLLAGVEDMALQFGIDNDDDSIADAVLATAAVGANDWENVMSVELELLVRSTDDNVSPVKQKYEFEGENKEAVDKRIRQVFSTAVGIRSRLQ